MQASLLPEPSSMDAAGLMDSAGLGYIEVSPDMDESSLALLRTVNGTFTEMEFGKGGNGNMYNLDAQAQAQDAQARDAQAKPTQPESAYESTIDVATRSMAATMLALAEEIGNESHKDAEGLGLMIGKNFHRHIQDAGKYLEIHKLGANQRIEMKSRQEKLASAVSDGVMVSVGKVSSKFNANIARMIERNREMFDQALEDHSASTKKHLRWVNEQFANKLTTARQANREEIKDTIALDKALLKERMREVKRRQAAEIEVVRNSFKDEIDKAMEMKEQAMTQKMVAEANMKKYLEMSNTVRTQRDAEIVKNEATANEVKRMQKLLSEKDAALDEMEDRLEKSAVEQKALSKKFAQQGKALKKLEEKRMQGNLSPRVPKSPTKEEEEAAIALKYEEERARIDAEEKLRREAEAATAEARDKMGEGRSERLKTVVQTFSFTPAKIIKGMAEDAEANSRASIRQIKKAADDLADASSLTDGQSLTSVNTEVPVVMAQTHDPAPPPRSQSDPSVEEKKRQTPEEEKADADELHHTEQELKKMELMEREQNLRQQQLELKSMENCIANNQRDRNLSFAVREDKAHVDMNPTLHGDAKLLQELGEKQERIEHLEHRLNVQTSAPTVPQQVTAATQMSPKHEGARAPASATAATQMSPKHEAASPTQYSVSSTSSLEMDRMDVEEDDDISETTWNDLRMGAHPVNELAPSPPPQEEEMIVFEARRTRTASGASLLDNVNINKDRCSPSTLAGVEEVAEESPMRGNMHARPREKERATVAVEQPETDETRADQRDLREERRSMEYVQEIADLNELHRREIEQEHIFMLTKKVEELTVQLSKQGRATEELRLSVSEKEMLLTELIRRLKKSNKEKQLVAGKLQKMESVYANNVTMRQMGLSGSNFEGGGAVARPSTAGEATGGLNMSGANIRRAVSSSKKTRKIRSDLKQSFFAE